MRIKRSLCIILVVILILSTFQIALHADMEHENNMYEPDSPVYCPLYPKHLPYWLWTSSVYV